MPAPEEALSAGNITFTGPRGRRRQRVPGPPRRQRPLPRRPGHPPPARLGLDDQGDHPPLRRRGLQRPLPQPLRPPGAPCRSRRRRGRHPRGRRHPRRPVRGRRRGGGRTLRALPTSNGKVGVIGYCSGGRHSFLTAVSVPVDAAVDCYGAFVTGTVPEGFPLKVTPLVDRTQDLRCPLLGLFGNDDQFPSPEQVDELEQALKAAGKTYEFHRYDGAGHAFFSVDRPGLPARGRGRRLAAHLRVVRPLPGGELTMCSYLTVATEIAGSAKGPQGWMPVTSASVYFDHPFHAPFDHTLNIDFADPARGPGARVAGRAQCRLGAPAGREHQRGARRCGGRRHVTTPTGPAAGVHLPWAEVPGAVRTWAAGVGGGAPTSTSATSPVGSRRGRPRCSTAPRGRSS